MNKAYPLAFSLFCLMTASVQADDGYEEYREAEKRYWEYQKERSKDRMEARKEHRKFHEEQERESRVVVNPSRTVG
ncbi:hypothetical protein I5E65_25105 [Pseudomonas aeruginosa]|nr:hypothetical protein [Pseudomonas aeruginosa]